MSFNSNIVKRCWLQVEMKLEDTKNVENYMVYNDYNNSSLVWQQLFFPLKKISKRPKYFTG